MIWWRPSLGLHAKIVPDLHLELHLRYSNVTWPRANGFGDPLVPTRPVVDGHHDRLFIEIQDISSD